MASQHRTDDPHVARLLAAAHAGAIEPLGELLQTYRNYLTILATTQLDRRLHRRISPSDLVQETMLAAHRDFKKFGGHTEQQFLAWLRSILINSLHHAVDAHLKAKRRDIRCEVSINQAQAHLSRSSLKLERILADPGPSPSAAAREHERAVVFANQLAKLSPAYREVIVLRNLQGLPFEEIAHRVNRKVGAVRMLWVRAIDKFKQVYDPLD